MARRSTSARSAPSVATDRGATEFEDGSHRTPDAGNHRASLGLAHDLCQATASERLAQRARQQAAIVQLGRLALGGGDLQLLFDQAVDIVAKTFDNDYCKVLELLPGGRELLLRAGVGWNEGLLGHATVDTDLDSQAGFTLRSKGPVIVEDLRTETRFHGPPLLFDHGVVSGMSVTIGPAEAPYGVLGTHARTPVLSVYRRRHQLLASRGPPAVGGGFSKPGGRTAKTTQQQFGASREGAHVDAAFVP